MKKFFLYICISCMFFFEKKIFSQTASWTFMVYLDADCDLEAFGIHDFNEMESVGSNSTINIIVLFDRSPDYDNSNGDWSGARIFRIMKDNDTALITSPVLKEMGNTNMGDSSTLQKFIQWTSNNYPAQKYALVLWNHGGGWQKKGDNNKSKVFKDICYDDTDKDYLSNSEVGWAIKNSGIHLNIISFDACLMGMIENAYQLKDNVDIFVGSEEIEPGEGWFYTPVLQKLIDQPMQTPASFAKTIVNEYANYYNKIDEQVTMSAIDLSMIPNISNKINSLVDELLTKKSDSTLWRQIILARDEADKFEYPENKDLWHLADLISQKVTDPLVAIQASDLRDAVAQSIIENFVRSSYSNSHGLAIYFPDSSNYNSFYSDKSNGIKFTHETKWDSLIIQSFIYDTTNYVDNFSYEPNDYFADAYLIKNKELIHSNLFYEYDKDYYKFEVPTTSTVDISLKLLVDFALFLYSVEGDKITIIDSSDNFGIQDEHLKKVLTKGVYYIEIIPKEINSADYYLTINGIETVPESSTYDYTLAYDFGKDNDMIFGLSRGDVIDCYFSTETPVNIKKIWIYIKALDAYNIGGNGSFDLIIQDTIIPIHPTNSGWLSIDVSDKNYLLNNFYVSVYFDGINDPGIGYNQTSFYSNFTFISNDSLLDNIAIGSVMIRVEVEKSYHTTGFIDNSSFMQNSMNEFPNPCHNEIYFRIYSNNQNPLKLFIYDLQGRLVHSEEIIINNYQKLFLLNTEDFKQGLYFFQIKGTNFNKSGKFIKE